MYTSYMAYTLSEKRAKVLSSTTLVLNRDDLKNLADELGIVPVILSSTKNKIPDRLDLMNQLNANSVPITIILQLYG